MKLEARLFTDGKNVPHMVGAIFEDYFKREGTLPNGKIPIKSVKIHEGKLEVWLASWGLQDWMLEIDLPEDGDDGRE